MYEHDVIYDSQPSPGIPEETVCAEIRHVIQNWRKENKLPIDYVIPTLYVNFKEPVIKSAIIMGKSDMTGDHVCKLCQISKVLFCADVPAGVPAEQDFYCWSPLGGTVGYGNVVSCNEKDLIKCINNKYITTYF